MGVVVHRRHVILASVKKKYMNAIEDDLAGSYLRRAYERSTVAYHDTNLDVAQNKGFCEVPDFVALGTHVNGWSGKVAAPEVKRLQLCSLTVDMLSIGYTTQASMRKVLCLLVFPFSHRRECMSTLQFAFTWASKLGPGKHWIPSFIRDELVSAVLVLPLCYSNCRWKVSPVLSATDATLQVGASAYALASHELTRALYHVTEQKGEHVRLDWAQAGTRVPPSNMYKPQDQVHDAISALRWHVSRRFRFGRRAHVNVHELRALKREIVRLAAYVPRPLRHINVVDSRVVLGCRGKGRSSSWRLNGVQRSTLPYVLAGRKQVMNVWSASAFNPSDDPSRDVEIRPQGTCPEWLRRFFASGALSGDPNPEVSDWHPGPLGGPRQEMPIADPEVSDWHAGRGVSSPPPLRR